MLRELREGHTSRGRTVKVYAGIDLSAHPRLPDVLATDGWERGNVTNLVVMLNDVDTLGKVTPTENVIGWSDPEGGQ